LTSDLILKQEITDLVIKETILLIPQKLTEPLMDCYLIEKLDTKSYSISLLQITMDIFHNTIQLSDLINYYKICRQVKQEQDIDIVEIYVTYITNDFGRLQRFKFTNIENVLRPYIGWRKFDFDTHGKKLSLDIMNKSEDVTDIIKKELNISEDVSQDVIDVIIPIEEKKENEQNNENKEQDFNVKESNVMTNVIIKEERKYNKKKSKPPEYYDFPKKRNSNETESFSGDSPVITKKSKIEK
jgi:hypothetical protein